MMFRPIPASAAAFLAAAALFAFPSPRVLAQDVEALGARYGTPVPEGYWRTRAADPGAFRFSRAWKGRTGRGIGLDRRGGGPGGDPGRPGGPALVEGGSGGPAAALGPRDAPVEGVFPVPVILGLFDNSPASPPFPRATIEDAYFGGGGGTITAFYHEMSGDRATLQGEVLEWVRAPRADTSYTVGESGLVSGTLGGGGAGNFVVDLLDRISGVDWGRYDNDGPDGIPNSGDDDGFVDVLAVVQPDRGGECGGAGSGDRIWSHRWWLSAAVSSPGQPYQTGTPAANGGFIKIEDYTIQPARSCTGEGLAEIGVFAHELGHAFGLPDLYDTNASDGTHSGAGNWDLMSSGSYGCDNASPELPCHMGAWSKEMLGWVDVVTLAPDTDHGTLSLPPVETGGSVLRIDAADGSGEYFLLENRRQSGFDARLRGEGLLIWQIDQNVVDATWSANRVNGAPHMGVRLRQADGNEDLERGRGRGDAGDPFPGTYGKTVFHTASVPSSLSFAGGVTGLTVYDIGSTGSDATFGLSTRFTSVIVETSGADAPAGLLTVNGEAATGATVSVSAPPFAPLSMVAAGGEVLAPGTRRPFTGWRDDPAAPAARTLPTPLTDTAFIAEYGGVEYLLSLTVSGGVDGVAPGIFTSDPAAADFWFAQGASVSLSATPRPGFDFLGWSGALQGQDNPALFTMDAPLDAGADFTLVYAVEEAVVELSAATDLDVQLQAVGGVSPVTWRLVSGSLPMGVALSRTGRLTGASVDVGRFQVVVEAVDAQGLPATGTVTLDFGLPALPPQRAAAPFLLTGEALTGAELTFLNRQGNGYGGYDLGDFRAWVLSSPDFPLAAEFGTRLSQGTVPVVVTGTVGEEIPGDSPRVGATAPAGGKGR